MQACSQPWVTAKSRAASREAKVLSTRNTRQSRLSPRARWTEKDARKRPQSVGCVAGETTYLPMEIAFFGMLFSQDCRLDSPDRSIFWLGWLLLCSPKSLSKIANGDLLEA
jgi:hypothetical protein